MHNVKLQEFVNRNKLSNNQIVDDLAVAKSVVSSYLSGSVKASKPFINKFANFYNINVSEIVDDVNNELPAISNSKGRPYYDVDFIGGFDLVLNDQSVRPSFFIDFLPFNDVDCWVNCTGKSMSPFISHGDIVGLKKVENWREFLLYGEIYAVVTPEFRTIKIIGKSESNKHFKLIPYSKSPEFSEQDLPVKLIDHIFRVKGSMKKFF